MGSGVLLAALVVLWFVVLVPMVVTRGDTHASAGAVDSGRTLQRRRPVDPVVHAETERVTIDRAALLSSGELKVDVHAVRRRTLAGLVALAVLALVGALTYRSWMWAPQALLDVAVVGYLMVIKAAADRERRAAARRHARAAQRARMEQEQERRRPAPRPVAPTAPPVPAVAETGPVHPSLPLAPVHPLRPGRVVAARVPVSAGWQHSAVVGLDDEDIGFAEIDVYAPKRVVNG
jgi:type II secretory pathway pseudopilin PulG